MNNNRGSTLLIVMAFAATGLIITSILSTQILALSKQAYKLNQKLDADQFIATLEVDLQDPMLCTLFLKGTPISNSTSTFVLNTPGTSTPWLRNDSTISTGTIKDWRVSISELSFINAYRNIIYELDFKFSIMSPSSMGSLVSSISIVGIKIKAVSGVVESCTN